MSEEISKILYKFDRTLENYELDKKVGQPSIESIYFLYPSEMITIKNYIRQKENIIKEVREEVKIYEEQNNDGITNELDNYVFIQRLKNVLDKENKDV